MTPKQKAWLDDHRRQGWSAVGYGGRYSKRGILHADGTFEEIMRGARPRITPGCFEVGKAQNEPPDAAA